MLFKLVDGKLIKSTVVRHTIDGKDFVTTNPTEELLVGLGYKPLETDIHQVVVHEPCVRVVVFGVHETEAVLFVERDCI